MSLNLDAFHSADVQIWLECEGHNPIPVRRVTPTSVVVQYPMNMPPCHAQLVVYVDGERLTTRVNLAGGSSPDRRSIMALQVDDVAPF